MDTIYLGVLQDRWTAIAAGTAASGVPGPTIERPRGSGVAPEEIDREVNGEAPQRRRQEREDRGLAEPPETPRID